MGADAYQTLTRRDQDSYESRTAAQYIATRVRQGGPLDGVAVAGFPGLRRPGEPTETIDGEAYVTRVYCHDGWLRELFTDASGDFAPEDGEPVLEAESLSVSLSGAGLLTVEITSADGETQQVTLYLRSGKEAAP